MKAQTIPILLLYPSEMWKTSLSRPFSLLSPRPPPPLHPASKDADLLGQVPRHSRNRITACYHPPAFPWPFFCILHLCLWVTDTTWAFLGASIFSSPVSPQYQGTWKGSAFGPVALGRCCPGCEAAGGTAHREACLGKACSLPANNKLALRFLTCFHPYSLGNFMESGMTGG